MGEIVGAGEGRLDGRAADGEQDADQRQQQADLAEDVLGGEGWRAEELGEMPRGRNRLRPRSSARATGGRRGRSRSSWSPVEAEVPWSPAVLDRARGVEVDLIRSHCCSEQADNEVRGRPRGCRRRVRPARSHGRPRPNRVQLDRRHREHEQTQAEVPEDPLDPVERQDPGAKRRGPTIATRIRKR